MIVAQITQDKPLQGFVTTDLRIAIQCQRTEAGWEPLFGIKRGEGKFELPHCFSLNDECIEALDYAVDDYNR